MEVESLGSISMGWTGWARGAGLSEEEILRWIFSVMEGVAGIGLGLFVLALASKAFW